MASLPDATEAVAKERQLYELIRGLEFDEVSWAVAPQVWLLAVGAERDDSSPRLLADLRNAVRAFSGSRGPRMWRCGGTLLFSTSVQTTRVLGPLANVLGDGTTGPQPNLSSIGAGDMIRARRQAKRSHEQIRAALSSVGVPAPEALYEELVQTAVLMRKVVALLGDNDFDTVVVATQHNSATRALLGCVRAIDGVQSVYVPHAPLADNPAYRDLPTDHALLRGPAEVSFYRRLEVDDSRLAVTGDPSVSDLPVEVPTIRRPPLFAAPPLVGRELAARVRVLAEAGVEVADVAPHPRSRREDVETACPSTWTVHQPGTTFAQMVAGPRAVIQDGSGVGLEALALGLPVINLLPPGRTPNYPYLADPLVENVRDSETLHRALNELSNDSATREQRRQFAGSWAATVGNAALQSLSNEVTKIRSSPKPRQVLLDGWATPAPQRPC